MLPIFEDYLFDQGYFVADEAVAAAAGDPQDELASRRAVAALMALGRYAEIRITAHAELADEHMLQVAERKLGKDVPEAFYRGFPNSVLKLTPKGLMLDQLLHYFRTYYLGDFSQAGHSIFEERYKRIAFAEKVRPKLFAILLPEEAEALLLRTAEGLLASTRPLNAASQELLEAYLVDHPGFVPERCASKDTAARIILDTRDLACLRFLELPDVIRLVEWLLKLRYQGTSTEGSVPGRPALAYAPAATLHKLNLRNQDRKLIASVLDELFARGPVDVSTCLEKRRLWCGLLHHLHYRPQCPAAEEFCAAMRGKERRSVYAAMERCLAEGDVRAATDVLRAGKGAGAILRHLNHLLSRLDTTDPERLEADVAYVLAACTTRNKILLVQLLQRYGSTEPSFTLAGHDPRERAAKVRELLEAGAYATVSDPYCPRRFTFVKLGMLRRHTETYDELARNMSYLEGGLQPRVETWVRDQLVEACRGTLGCVYVAPGLANAAVPLQEAASFGGFGTLPRGTRIPLPAGKKVRAFTYWEEVDDIDLSCFALYDDGHTREFSWRTMWGQQSAALTFSGDQTSGYYGGSEFFDVDPVALAEQGGPGCHYLVFCDNVFSSGTFAECVCRAGYMLRDRSDSGEVFEPATVQTSFAVDCASRAAYLFALDLADPALVWLNLGEHSMENIAGEGDVSFLLKYLHVTDVFNLRDFAILLATEVVDSPAEADVVFADVEPEELGLREDQELIRPRNSARLLELLNA